MFGKLLIGLIGVILLSYGAFFTTRDKIQEDLTKRTMEAFAAAGTTWATVTFPSGKDHRYRQGLITGPAPNQEAIDAAEQLASAVTGVHKATYKGDAIGAAPYVWGAELQNDQVVLSGMVPSQEIRSALVDHARNKFSPKQVIDNMVVTTEPKEPAGDWQGAAVFGLEQLAKLDTGQAGLTNFVLNVQGMTAKPETVAAVTTALQTSMPAGFSGNADIKGPDVAAAPPGPALDPCDAKVDALMKGQTIEFATGKADLQTTPNPLLDSIAKTANECPATRIEPEWPRTG
jgi:OmpA-OmpF porin, OOP family